jgi:hypothetical protein
MMRRQLVALGALTLLVACSGITTHIDYDRNADLGSYNTFAWAPTTETSMQDTSPLMHDRTVSYITKKIRDGGMTQVESDPDLYITYHTSEREEMQLNTTGFGYGYGPGYRYDPYWGMGMGTTTTTVNTYTTGTLIIDAWDAKKKELVWRGVVEGVVPEDPQKAEQKIYKAIDEMAKKWAQMKAEDQS